MPSLCPLSSRAILRARASRFDARHSDQPHSDNASSVVCIGIYPLDPKADGRDPFDARHSVLDEYGIPRDDGRELQGRRIPYDWSRVYR